MCDRPTVDCSDGAGAAGGTSPSRATARAAASRRRRHRRRRQRQTKSDLGELKRTTAPPLASRRRQRLRRDRRPRARRQVRRATPVVGGGRVDLGGVDAIAPHNAPIGEAQYVAEGTLVQTRGDRLGLHRHFRLLAAVGTVPDAQLTRSTWPPRPLSARAAGPPPSAAGAAALAAATVENDTRASKLAPSRPPELRRTARGRPSASAVPREIRAPAPPPALRPAATSSAASAATPSRAERSAAGGGPGADARARAEERTVRAAAVLNAEGELLRAEHKERRAALAPRGGAADEVQSDARAVDAHAERAAATARWRRRRGARRARRRVGDGDAVSAEDTEESAELRIAQPEERRSTASTSRPRTGVLSTTEKTVLAQILVDGGGAAAASARLGGSRRRWQQRRRRASRARRRHRRRRRRADRRRRRAAARGEWRDAASRRELRATGGGRAPSEGRRRSRQAQKRATVAAAVAARPAAKGPRAVGRVGGGTLSVGERRWRHLSAWQRPRWRR